MRDINHLIENIIPYPADYSTRNGFNNESIINDLDIDEKILVEEALIKLLDIHPDDELIIETLANLKSEKSLPKLYKLLEKSQSGLFKLKIATTIYQINHDADLIEIAVKETKQLDNEKDAYNGYKLIAAFYCLEKFQNDETNSIIMSYTGHDEYLISYNAKRALKLNS